jgi:hypothetical protein
MVSQGLTRSRSLPGPLHRHSDKGSQRNNPSLCLMALAVAARAFAAGFPGTLSAPPARRFMIVVGSPRYWRVSYHDHRNEPGAKIKPAY